MMATQTNRRKSGERARDRLKEGERRKEKQGEGEGKIWGKEKSWKD